MGFQYKKQMPSAQHLKELIPVTPAMAKRRRARMDALERILSGGDRRLQLIIGP